jgi:hypothetical protein
MKKSLLLVSCVYFLTTSAQASNVILEGSNAVGIQKFVVGEDLYDVIFETIDGSAIPDGNGHDGLPYDPRDIFVNSLDPGVGGDAAGAQMAANNIATLLQAAGAATVGQSAIPGPATTWNSFIVPYRYESPPTGTTCEICMYRGSNLIGPWVATSAEGDYLGTFTFAKFSPSAVPIPPALWLFGSGLFGLVGIAHRRRKAA